MNALCGIIGGLNNDKNMKYFKHTFLAIICLLAFGGVVLAEPISERRVQTQEKMQEIKLRASSTSTRSMSSSTREEVLDRVCAKLSSRIDSRIANFDEVFSKHLEIYNMHKEKISQIESKLALGGLDTSKLKTDISTLETKIATFSSDATKVKETLENTRSFSCGNSEGDFKSAIETVRTAQKLVRTDAQDIRDFITKTLIKDVQDLRALKNNTNEKQ